MQPNDCGDSFNDRTLEFEWGRPDGQTLPVSGPLSMRPSTPLCLTVLPALVIPSLAGDQQARALRRCDEPTIQYSPALPVSSFCPYLVQSYPSLSITCSFSGAPSQMRCIYRVIAPTPLPNSLCGWSPLHHGSASCPKPKAHRHAHVNDPRPRVTRFTRRSASSAS